VICFFFPEFLVLFLFFRADRKRAWESAPSSSGVALFLLQRIEEAIVFSLEVIANSFLPVWRCSGLLRVSPPPGEKKRGELFFFFY